MIFPKEFWHNAATSVTMPTMKAADTPMIECHPPERRRRIDVRMCHGSCCCCCCLHTIGGIVGAGVAPLIGAKNPLPLGYYYEEEDEYAVPDVSKPGVSAVKVFWFMSLAAAMIGGLIGSANGGQGFFVALVILFMVFPGVQLACAIVTLIWLALSTRPDKSFQLKQVGKLTLGLVLGTVAGILAMVGILALFSLR